MSLFRPSSLRREPVLFGILLVAAAVRLIGIRFGLPHPYSRPDESAIGAVALGFYHGQWNPHFFNYPPLFMLVVAGAVSLWLHVGWWLGYIRDAAAIDALLAGSTVHVAARLLSAAAGVATAYTVYRAAARLFDRTTARVAAFFLALAFLHVRDSHFGVTDIAATFLATAAFVAIVSLEQTGSGGALIASALLAGLATATKYNVALIAAPALLVIAADDRRPMRARIARAFGFVGLMVATFVAVAPYSVLAWPEFVSALRSESAHLRGGHGVIVGRGWHVHLSRTLRYGLGIPLLTAGLGGLAWMIRERPWTAAVVGSFPIVYFAVLGSGYTVFVRYMLPIVPFLCLAGSYGVVCAVRASAVAARRPSLTSAAVAVAAALVIAPSAVSVFKFDRLMSVTDNRVVAARWIARHFPNGAVTAQYGPEGGHVFIDADDPERARRFSIVRFDGTAPRPDVIVVQSSPLTGEGDVNGAAPVIAREYRLASEFRTGSADRPRVYDLQDEFYVPLSGFDAIVRPGPDLRIYVLRDPR